MINMTEPSSVAGHLTNGLPRITPLPFESNKFSRQCQYRCHSLDRKVKNASGSVTGRSRRERRGGGEGSEAKAVGKGAAK